MPRQPPTYRYVSGTDPDCTKSGYVVYDLHEKRWHEITTLTLDDWKADVLTYEPGTILFVIEAGWLNPAIWHGKDTTDWNPNKAKAYGAAIGKSVGANHEIGRQQIAYLQAHGHEVDPYRPRGRKWDAALFKRVTGLSKGYNPEIRDAVRAISSHIF